MEEREGDCASEGSDIEVDRRGEEDFVADIDGENELVEVHNQALQDELNDYARQIFASDDEEEDFLGFQANWTCDRDRFQSRRKKTYTRSRGLAPGQQLSNQHKAVDFFNLFWDNELWEMMLAESNRYAKQQREANPPPPSFAKFSDFSMAELRTFVGLCLMMGILRLPKRSDYWRRKQSCWLAHTNFGKAMSRNRFDTIWRYLHLENNQVANVNGDKLIKLRKFLDILLKNFRGVFVPGK